MKAFKKDVPAPVQEKPAPKVEVPAPTEAGCVECGGPLAPGQTYVCKNHIRTN